MPLDALLHKLADEDSIVGLQLLVGLEQAGVDVERSEFSSEALFTTVGEDVTFCSSANNAFSTGGSRMTGYRVIAISK